MTEPPGAWMQDASAAKSQGCREKRKWLWLSQAKGDIPAFTYCLYSPLSASLMVIIKSSEKRSPAMVMLICTKWQVKWRAKARDFSQACSERY